jgi:hypothetical protein
LPPQPLPLASRRVFRQTMSKPVGLAIRMTPAERDWFHAIAKARGTTLSELIRVAVASEAVALGLEVPAASPAT